MSTDQVPSEREKALSQEYDRGFDAGRQSAPASSVVATKEVETALAMKKLVDDGELVLRSEIIEECAQVAWNHEPDENGPIETAIRALKRNASPAASERKEFRFERIRNGRVMAEDIVVHTATLAEATEKAKAMAVFGDEIRLAENAVAQPDFFEHWLNVLAQECFGDERPQNWVAKLAVRVRELNRLASSASAHNEIAAPPAVAQSVRASGKSAEAEDTEGRGFESRQPEVAASSASPTMAKQISAPSPLGYFAAVLAEYDGIVNARLDPRDAEADFVMRGSDWRVLRRALTPTTGPYRTNENQEEGEDTLVLDALGAAMTADEIVEALNKLRGALASANAQIALDTGNIERIRNAGERAEAELETVQYRDNNLKTLCSMVEGLHAMIFGVTSIESGDFAIKALKDGGSIHEYVHSMLRLLPPRIPPLESDGIGKPETAIARSATAKPDSEK